MNKPHVIYRITNLINKKIYIGQTISFHSRWRDHKREARQENPSMIIHKSMKKYGIDNFIIEVIASIIPTNDEKQDYLTTSDIETEIIIQEESHISFGKGYNVSPGGPTAPKSESFKQMMKDWRASLSPEKRAEISKKQSESYKRFIKEKGPPGLGKKRTPEQVENLKKARKEHPVEYTPEIRQRMREAHLGKKQPEELIKKRGESFAKTHEKKIEELIAAGKYKCHYPGCEVSGKTQYILIDGVRYCRKHHSAIKWAKNKKPAKKINYADFKCNSPGCGVKGKAKYVFFEGIRYCVIHGDRLRYHKNKKLKRPLLSEEIKCHDPECNKSGKNYNYSIIDGLRYCNVHGGRLKRKQKREKAALIPKIDDRKCYADGCEVHGSAKYRFVNGIRYCSRHADRLLYKTVAELKILAETTPSDDERKCSIEGCEIRGRAKYGFIDNVRYCKNHYDKLKRQMNPKPKIIKIDDRRCSVEGCEVSGKHHYRYINGIRYCNNHGRQLKFKLI